MRINEPLWMQLEYIEHSKDATIEDINYVDKSIELRLQNHLISFELYDILKMRVQEIREEHTND